MKQQRVFGAIRHLCATAVMSAALVTQPAIAQFNVPADASLPGARVILLGTGGGPILRKGRSQPANLLVVDGVAYMIDAGDGAARQMTFAGVPISKLRAVFLTHLHFDHTAGLSSAIGFRWMATLTSPKLPQLGIYGPPGTDRMVGAADDYLEIPTHLFRNAQPDAPSVRAIVSTHVASPGVIYEDDKVKVTAVENTHYSGVPMSPTAYGRDVSYSYRFDTKYGSVAFSGDTGPSNTVAELAKGADIFVCEVNDVDGIVAMLRNAPNMPPEALSRWTAHMEHEHLSPDEVGKLAARAGVKMVVLSHFSIIGEVGSDMTPWTTGVRKYFKGAIVPGKDLDEYDLN